MAAPAMAPVDVDLVVGVQRGLRRLGFYRGVVNGVSDASTRAAIRAYEANMGLPVTGVMSPTLMRALGIF
jgi:peptidoglycan hydrolase-like protein with peptidoglycan-binding domain